MCAGGSATPLGGVVSGDAFSSTVVALRCMIAPHVWSCSPQKVTRKVFWGNFGKFGCACWRRLGILPFIFPSPVIFAARWHLFRKAAAPYLSRTKVNLQSQVAILSRPGPVVRKPMCRICGFAPLTVSLSELKLRFCGHDDRLLTSLLPVTVVHLRATIDLSSPRPPTTTTDGSFGRPR